MALTQAERARLIGLWRALADDCLNGHVTANWRDALDWQSPLDDVADSYALFAFARLTKSAHKAATQRASALRRPALTALAMLALAVLPEAAAPRAHPELPFRADLDG